MHDFIDTNHDGKLSGIEAIEFLRTSGLNVDQLEEIWNIIDMQVSCLSNTQPRFARH
jgi:hypothetical protein